MVNVYIAKNINDIARSRSRSGGVFFTLTEVIFSKKGGVVGCRLDKDFNAEHIYTESREIRDSFNGSKYVQSNIKNCYREIKNALSLNKMVLFSGTPCQIAGVKAYLRTSKCETRNFLTVDIVCHGVPSPALWQAYLKYMSQKCGGDIESVDFRDKKYGWNSHFETIKISGVEYKNNDFTQIYYSHHCLRPSCYSCHFKNTKRISDITLADAWGVEKNNADFNDNRGVSLVLVNTPQGTELFDQCKMNLDFREVNIADFLQAPLKGNYSVPRGRNKFWQLYHKMGIGKIIKLYGGTSIRYRTNQLAKKLLPRNLVNTLRSLKVK